MWGGYSYREIDVRDDGGAEERTTAMCRDALDGRATGRHFGVVWPIPRVVTRALNRCALHLLRIRLCYPVKNCRDSMIYIACFSVPRVDMGLDESGI